MTYKAQKMNMWTHKIPLIGIGIVIVFGAALSISLYSDTVDLRHELEAAEVSIQRQEVGNAELKNMLYTLLDTENLERVASELGLVLERNPDYLEADVAIVASNL